MGKQIKNDVVKSGMNEGVWVQMWDDSIYSTAFWLVICKDSIQEFEHLYKRVTNFTLEDKTGYHGLCQEAHDPDGRQHVFIVLTEKSSQATKVHEVIHAVNFVYKLHGVKLDPDNDEHQAYYTDSIIRIVEEGYEKLDRYKQATEQSYERKRKADPRKGKQKPKQTSSHMVHSPRTWISRNSRGLVSNT
jgi:hypothetical protein